MNVIDILRYLNSSGIDNILNKAGQIIKNIIVLPITTIINDFLMLFYFPNKLTIAKVKQLAIQKINPPLSLITEKISLLPVPEPTS